MKKTKSKESSFGRIARQAREQRAAGSSSSQSPCSVNRFHIDVRSDMTIGDMEWAKALLLINMMLEQQGMPHIEAHLEEYPT